MHNVNTHLTNIYCNNLGSKCLYINICRVRVPFSLPKHAGRFGALCQSPSCFWRCATPPIEMRHRQSSSLPFHIFSCVILRIFPSFCFSEISILLNENQMSEVLFLCPYGAIFRVFHLCLSLFDPKINEQLPVSAANMGLDITVSCY